MLAGAFVGTLLPPAKMGSLELLLLRTVTLSHQLPLCHVLLLPTLPSQWPQLVFARALVGAFFPLVKNELDRVVSIDDSGTRNIPLLSPKAPIYHPPVKRINNDEPAEQVPRASIDSSGSHAFTLIPARAYRFLLCSSLQ